MSKDSFQTTSGLLDAYEMDVKEAWFGPAEDSDDDERIYLHLRGDAVDDEGEEHEDHTERYSTGQNWEIVDDGEAVENASGRNRFNRNTGIGRFIDALITADGADLEALGKRGDAFEAKTYVGLHLEMKNELVSTFENDDGEKVEWYLNLPQTVEIPKGKAKSKAKAKKGGSGKASRSGGSTSKSKAKKAKTDDLRADVLAFAGEFDDDEHDEFVTQVMDESIFERAGEIEDDDELHAEVLDEDSDLWEEAH